MFTDDTNIFFSHKDIKLLFETVNCKLTKVNHITIIVADVGIRHHRVLFGAAMAPAFMVQQHCKQI